MELYENNILLIVNFCGGHFLITWELITLVWIKPVFLEFILQFFPNISFLLLYWGLKRYSNDICLSSMSVCWAPEALETPPTGTWVELCSHTSHRQGMGREAVLMWFWLEVLPCCWHGTEEGSGGTWSWHTVLPGITMCIEPWVPMHGAREP